MRSRLALFLLLLGLLALLAAPAAAQDTDRQTDPTALGGVDVVEAVGVLDAPLTGYVVDAITAANERGSEVLVIQLDTPGALGGDIDALVTAIRESAVPIAVYVGTPGATAAGAGVRVAANAHVLALAPATVFGAATPQDLGEPDALDVGEVADLLIAEGEAAGRAASFLAEAADGGTVIAVPDGETGAEVEPSTVVPRSADETRVRTLDQDALVAAGIADIVAPTLQEALFDLGGREVVTAAGPVTLEVDPVTSNVRFVNLDLIGRILHTAASPTLAYLLLLVGAMTLLFEVFQPGFGVAGFAGIGVFGLGIYSMVPLPMNLLWFAVAAVGLLLLAYDLAIAGLSWPTALGTVLLGAGSLQMFDTPPLTPPVWLVVVGTLSAALFFVIVMTSVLRAQGNQALRGAEAVTGKVGVVRSVLNPEGHVYVGGALWRARAPEEAGRVRTGSKVKVLGLNDRLTLDVEVMADADTRELETN